MRRERLSGFIGVFTRIGAGPLSLLAFHGWFILILRSPTVLMGDHHHQTTSEATWIYHAFYAPMMESSATTDQSRHSVAEHQEALELLEKLNDTDMSSAAWLVTFKRLVHDNEHHMEEEENEVFTAVRNELSAGEIDSMNHIFEERKKQEMKSSV